MWWASAGEKRHSDEVDEQSRDASLLADLAGLASPVMGASPVQQQQQQQRRGSFGVVAATAVPGGGSLVASLASLTGGLDRSGDGGEEEAQARVELAVVAYFHRLTSAVMGVVAGVVDAGDEDDLLGLGLGLDGGFDDGPSSGLGGSRSLVGDDEEGRGEEAGLLRNAAASAGASAVDDGRGRMPWVRVDSEALAEMGLDVWSQTDADFVREMAVRYFGRRAYVETKGVEVCGVRVC
jgi:hypothetical protein